MQLPDFTHRSGKVAVVIGGGGVLCSDMARALAKTGAKVAILDLKPEAAESVATGVREDGGEALALTANVLDRASLEAAAAAVQNQFGPCDILVNGAGGNHPKGTTTRERQSLEDFLQADPAVVSFFVTDQNRGLLFTPEGGLTERSGKILGHTPMGRFGESRELIGAMLWLTSEEAAGFVSGVVVPVDGGFSAYSGV